MVYSALAHCGPKPLRKGVLRTAAYIIQLNCKIMTLITTYSILNCMLKGENDFTTSCDEVYCDLKEVFFSCPCMMMLSTKAEPNFLPHITINLC